MPNVKSSVLSPDSAALILSKLLVTEIDELPCGLKSYVDGYPDQSVGFEEKVSRWIAANPEHACTWLKLSARRDD